MPDQNFDQNDQNSWVQSVGNAAGNRNNQQPWSTGQGGQIDQGGLGGAPVHAVRQNIENQINGLIDHLAGQVPGGHMFAPEAKQAMSGVLDGLQAQLESQVQARAGGLLGGNQGSQL
jgi:hypothetical protein